MDDPWERDEETNDPWELFGKPFGGSTISKLSPTLHYRSCIGGGSPVII